MNRSETCKPKYNTGNSTFNVKKDRKKDQLSSHTIGSWNYNFIWKETDWWTVSRFPLILVIAWKQIKIEIKLMASSSDLQSFTLFFRIYFYDFHFLTSQFASWKWFNPVLRFVLHNVVSMNYQTRLVKLAVEYNLNTKMFAH